MTAHSEDSPSPNRDRIFIDLAGAVAIWTGATSTLGMVRDRILDGTAEFDLLALALVLGFGIFRRGKHSLGCLTGLVRLMAFLLLFCIGVMIVTGLFRDGTGEFSTSFPDGRTRPIDSWWSYSIGAVLLGGFLVLLLWLQHRLGSESVQKAYAQLESEPGSKSPPWWIWLLLTVILVNWLAELETERFHRKDLENLESYFPVHVAFNVTDRATGEKIKGSNVSNDIYSREDFLDGASLSIREDGWLLSRAIAKRPFFLEVSAEGYEPAEIEITEDTEEQIEIFLDRADQSPTPKSELVPTNDN